MKCNNCEAIFGSKDFEKEKFAPKIEEIEEVEKITPYVEFTELTDFES